MGVKDKSVYFTVRVYSDDFANGARSYGATHKLIRTRTGVSNPHWRQKVADELNATTNLDGTYVTASSTRGYGKNTTTVGKSEWSGDLAAYLQTIPTAPTIVVTTAHQRAVQQFLKQLRSAQVQMSGQVFIGELKEALHMLRHPAEGLVKAIKGNYLEKLKRLKKRDPKRWHKAISQTWLEASFGWLPFVNDLADAAKAYNSVVSEREHKTVPLRAVGKDARVVDQFAGYANFPPGITTQIRTFRLTRDEAICVIRGRAIASANTTLMDKARVFGLSPYEFLPTVWELLPWSFLVDYFSNIGDILENSVTDMSRLAWASETDIIQRSRNAVLQNDYRQTKAAQGVTFISCDEGSPSLVSWRYRVVKRRPGADLSIPPLTFELPGRPAQWANMVALFAQTQYQLHPQKPFRSFRR